MPRVTGDGEEGRGHGISGERRAGGGGGGGLCTDVRYHPSQKKERLKRNLLVGQILIFAGE